MQKPIGSTKKTILISFFFCATSIVGWSHNFYFAYAEIEYDELSSKLEATLVVTAHDFEFNLKKVGKINSSIESVFLDTVQRNIIEIEINKHLVLDFDNQSADLNHFSHFKIDGYNFRLNGDLEIFMSSDVSKPITSLLVLFDLLMDEYPNQQNKLTFIQRRSKKTLNFISSNQTQYLDLR